MSKYDITGIGINLREVSDGGGNVKLKVLGLVLDSPADIAGVKQVKSRSCFFLESCFAAGFA